MQVKIERVYAAMLERAAQVVAEVVRQKPNVVLGLATGSTPERMYRSLIRIAREKRLDFSQAATFNLDEYDGLPAAHPQSDDTFMGTNLFDGLDLREEQTNILDGMASDLAVECVEYEERIQRAGGIDIQVLGIGGDGHIAFCEPGSSLGGRTSVVALHSQTIEDNNRFFDRIEEVPRRALSMGVGTILDARSCLILAGGEKKAEPWAQMIEGPISSQLTASALQLHPWLSRYRLREPPRSSTTATIIGTSISSERISRSYRRGFCGPNWPRAAGLSWPHNTSSPTSAMSLNHSRRVVFEDCVLCV